MGGHPQSPGFLIDLHKSGSERTPDRQMLRNQFRNTPTTAERKIARPKRNLQAGLLFTRDEQRSRIHYQSFKPTYDHCKLSANVTRPNLFRKSIELILRRWVVKTRHRASF